MPDELKPEMVEVELLSGVKVSLPKEQAQKEIEHRQRHKTEHRSALEELGRVKAEKDAEAQRATDASRALDAEKAMKAGELDKAKQILTQASEEKLGKIERNYRRARLEAMVSANPNVIPEAVKDIADALCHSCRFDLDTESLAAVGADGKPRVGQDGTPVSADALLSEFLNKRPYLRKSTTPPGSGAAGGAGNTPAGKSLLLSERDRLPAKEKAAHFDAGGTLRDS